MSEDQLQLEVDWCVTRLEEKLVAMDPYSRPAQEAAKVHRILKSSKAPVIKKRQAMRNMFGDYRAKMKAMEKKSLAAMKKSKLVAVTEPPGQSRFLRRSTGAQTAQEASEKCVTSAADDLTQLSVTATQTLTNPPETCETDSDPAGIQLTLTNPPETCETDSDPAGIKSDISTSGESAGVKSSDMFTSGGDFKFSFDSSECGPDTDGGVNSAGAASSSAGAVPQNYFVIKPSSEEFRFNFTVDEEN
ncbi:hypothetical protein ACOMHN_007266 [Nucella lapillus]